MTANDPIFDPTLEKMRQAFLQPVHKVARPDRADAAANLVRLSDYRKRMPADRGLSVRWYTIMTLHMRGMSQAEIAKKVNLNTNTVNNICRSDKYRAAFKLRLEGLDDELLTLKSKAIQALDSALTSPNPDTQLRAASEFFKTAGVGMHGKGRVDGGTGVGAEDLARALLVAAKQEVHIHVGHEGGQPGQAGRILEAGEVGDVGRGTWGGVPRGPQGEQGRDHQLEAADGREPQGVEDARQCDGQVEHREAGQD